MALVHEGVNMAKYRIQQYIDDRVEADQRFYEKQKARRPREILLCWIGAAICAAVLLAVILNPGMVTAAKEAVYDGLVRFGKAVQKFDIFFGAEKEGLTELLMNIVRLVVFLVMRIFTLIIRYLLAPLLKLLTMVLMYALPVAGAGWCLFTIFWGEPFYADPEAVRANAAKHLPADLEVERIGLEGEETAVKFLSRSLDDTFHIYTNLYVPHDGDDSETDMIVVGLNGVTLVEVKNHKHNILGDLSDHDLISQHFSHGKNHLNPFYNPVKQVGTHVWRTANYLRRVCRDVRVNSCVLFVNPECTLKMTDRTGAAAKCPVFKGSDPALISYILRGSGRNFSVEEYKTVLWELEKLVCAERKGS